MQPTWHMSVRPCRTVIKYATHVSAISVPMWARPFTHRVQVLDSALSTSMPKLVRICMGGG